MGLASDLSQSRQLPTSADLQKGDRYLVSAVQGVGLSLSHFLSLSLYVSLSLPLCPISFSEDPSSTRPERVEKDLIMNNCMCPLPATLVLEGTTYNLYDDPGGPSKSIQP